jgi:hypothetical protein
LSSIVAGWIGTPPSLTLNPGATNIGAHLFIGKFMMQFSSGIFLGFVSLFLLLLFFVVLRRERLAFGFLWLLLTTVGILLGDAPVQVAFLTALGAFLPVYVLYRFGLLASVASFFFVHLAIYYPITPDFTRWYAADFMIAVVISLAIVAYGFYISLAGQPLFSGKFLADD